MSALPHQVQATDLNFCRSLCLLWLQKSVAFCTDLNVLSNGRGEVKAKHEPIKVCIQQAHGARYKQPPRQGARCKPCRWRAQR